MTQAQTMATYQALAEPVRLHLIELLCTGAHTSGDLAVMAFDRFGIGWGAVSRHLGILRAAGFVQMARDGPTRWYALEEEWLDLIDEAKRPLVELWDEHDGHRRLGVDVAPFVSWRDDGFQKPREQRRGLRGRARVNEAARGVGRSSSAEGADGGDGFG